MRKSAGEYLFRKDEHNIEYMPFAADPTLDVLAAVIPHHTFSSLVVSSLQSCTFSIATPVDVVSTRRKRIRKKKKGKGGKKDMTGVE